MQSSMPHVNVMPFQGSNFTPAHTCCYRKNKQSFIWMPVNSLKKPLCLFHGKRMYLIGNLTRYVNAITDVLSKYSPAHRAFECFVQHPMNDNHRVSRKPFL